MGSVNNSFMYFLHFVVVKKETFKGFLQEKKHKKGVKELFLNQTWPLIMKEGIVKEALKKCRSCFE